MIRTNIFLPEQFLIKLRALAKATGLTVAEHVRRAIDDYLSKNK
ncbi:MAG: ribbon-helix-helix protein, CopG family [Acidiferrobacter sp.]